jgi:hypothetical protein
VGESKPRTGAGAGVAAGAAVLLAATVMLALLVLVLELTLLVLRAESNESCAALLPKLRSFRPDGARSSGDGGSGALPGLPVLARLGESAMASVSESRRFSKKRTDPLARFSARTGAADEEDKADAEGADAAAGCCVTEPNATVGALRGEHSGDESLSSSEVADDLGGTMDAAVAVAVASSSPCSDSLLRDDNFDEVDVMDRLLRYEVVVEMLKDLRKEGDEPPTGDAGADLVEYGGGCGAQHSPEWKHSSCVRAANSASKRAYSEVSAIAPLATRGAVVATRPP